MRLEGSTHRRRVLFVGATGFDLPLSPSLAKKWDAISEQLDVRVIGRARSVLSGDPRFRPIPLAPPPLRGLGYYVSLPAIVARELRRFGPEVVVTQSPYEAFVLLPVLRLGRPRPKLVVELHGDWRTASRLYGSRLRRLYAGATDRAAVYALRRADGTRALSDFTASLARRATGRAPVATFPAYIDLDSFTREPPRPLPARPVAAWVGVLQRYKDPSLLADAWRRVVSRTDATLVVVGQGPLHAVVEELVRELPTRVRRINRLNAAEVAELMDNSTLLAMSSQSEGYPRVIMEAFARARAVVAPRVGGIPDLVEAGRNGMLVEPGDADALADALVRVLDDRQSAERLGRAAFEDARELQWTASRYASAVRDLIESVLV